MTPIDIRLISRKDPTRSKVRRIYLISEGTLTEPSFLKSILTDSPYLSNQLDMDFYETERSGKEFGINTIQGMVDLAYANIINNSSRFSKKKDKVICETHEFHFILAPTHKIADFASAVG